MIKVTFDFGALVGLDNTLAALSAEQIGQVNVEAVNEVTTRSYDTARGRMIAGINLPDSYLRERMSITPASNIKRPEAVIRAAYRHTLLSRYGARQVTQIGSGRGRGDPSRGIAPGSRGAGVSVEVTRGSRKTIQSAFLMRLKNGNGMGLFVRDPGAKKPRVLYGPSVWQLFRKQIENMAPEILDDLERTATAGLTRLIRSTA